MPKHAVDKCKGRNATEHSEIKGEKAKDCDKTLGKIIEDAIQKLLDLIGAITKDFAARVDQDTIDINHGTTFAMERNISRSITQLWYQTNGNAQQDCRYY